MKVLIIGKEDCTQCRSAQEFSKVKGVDFEYKKVPEDMSLDDAYKLTGTMFRSFPAIMVNDEFVGSFAEYQRYIVRNK